MNFTKMVSYSTETMEWQTSPMTGVYRKPLARENAESGHATSIVRYDKACRFKEHFHPYGEEIFVLEGVFSDEYGDYPQGSYIRNPPGSKHSPFSEEGCVIFVKLNQFSLLDTKSCRINILTESWQPGLGDLSVMPLHSFETEHTALVKWPKGETFKPHRHFGGEEILVLSGEFKDEHGSYPKGSWIRSPHMSSHCPYVEEDTVIFVKTGHLPVNG